MKPNAIFALGLVGSCAAAIAIAFGLRWFELNYEPHVAVADVSEAGRRACDAQAMRDAVRWMDTHPQNPDEYPGGTHAQIAACYVRSAGGHTKNLYGIYIAYSRHGLNQIDDGWAQVASGDITIEETQREQKILDANIKAIDRELHIMSQETNP